MLLNFIYKGSHGHSLALYFLHENLKFIAIIRENNRHIHITCISSFHLFNRDVGWIPLLSYWRIDQVFYLFYQVGTLPSCATFVVSNPEFEDSTIVLLLNFCGKCANVPRNYSLSELNMCQNLTSVETKNGSLSSLDSCLDSK